MKALMNEYETNHPRWEKMWASGLKPGAAFDAKGPCPALQQLIDRSDIPSGRALVPGCGRGYDVNALCSSDRLCLGIDLSPTGVEAAQIYLESQASENPLLTVNATIQQANFFDLSEDEKFDFVYDYTFLCALDPSIRIQWAQKMARLIKPGGELLTLIFPIIDRSGGPPFAMSLELVRSLVEPAGFTCKQLELLSPELCHPGRGGVDGSPSSGIGRWIRNSN